MHTDNLDKLLVLICLHRKTAYEKSHVKPTQFEDFSADWAYLEEGTATCVYRSMIAWIL
jgi:hypothetical protein